MENHMGPGPEHHDAAPMTGGKVCKCGHHKVMPILVILLGLEFLLAQINVLTWGFVNVTWPILVIIAGIMKLVRCNCCMK